MIELVYEKAGVIEARTFGGSNELADWLKRQCLIEKVTIIKLRDKV